MAQETKSHRRLIRRNELPDFGLDWGDTQLWQLVKDGLFPAPVRHKDGGRAIGWLSNEIDAWFEARAAERDARLAAQAALAQAIEA